MVILIVTACLNAAMTQGCETKRIETARQYACEWRAVEEQNRAYKHGKFASGACRSSDEERVAKK